MKCPYNDCDYDADGDSVERHVHFMTLNQDSRHTAANLGEVSNAVAAQIVTEPPAVVLPYQADETVVIEDEPHPGWPEVAAAADTPPVTPADNPPV